MIFFSTRVNIEVIFWLTVRTFSFSFLYCYIKDWLKQTSTENRSTLADLFVNENIMDALRYMHLKNNFLKTIFQDSFINNMSSYYQVIYSLNIWRYNSKIKSKMFLNLILLLGQLLTSFI